MSTRMNNPVKPEAQWRVMKRSSRPMLTRRSFFKLAALGAAASAVACTQAPLPTATPSPTPTVIPPTPTPTPIPKVLDEALITQIENIVNKSMLTLNDVPGVALGIIKDNQVAYTKGFGVAEVGTERAVTPGTVFTWGLVSMPVTATAVMQLWAEGKIDLDMPVTQYLPYFQMADERYRDITPRHVLSHTASLPPWKGEDSDWGTEPGSADALEQHVRSLASVAMNVNAVGKAFSVSYVGFEILGDLIAKVSGQPFEGYVQEHIFAPLGMEHTTYDVSEVDPTLLTAFHTRSNTGALVPEAILSSRQHAPSTALLSTIEDMARFGLMQLNHGLWEGAEILTAEACAEMWKVHVSTPFNSGGVGWKHCLGWLCGQTRADRQLLIYDAPYSTVVVLAPEGGAGIILAMNYAPTSFWPNLSPIMDQLLGDA